MDVTHIFVPVYQHYNIQIKKQNGIAVGGFNRTPFHFLLGYALNKIRDPLTNVLLSTSIPLSEHDFGKVYLHTDTNQGLQILHPFSGSEHDTHRVNLF